MKHKIRFYHFQIYIFVLLGLILMAVIYITEPQETIYDYALSLEDDQFFSGDKSVWELDGVLESGALTVSKLLDVENQRFKIEPTRYSASDILPYSLAFHTLDAAQVFIRGDGSVWRAYNYNRKTGQMQLLPFALPAGDIQTGQGVEADSFEIYLYQETRNSYNPYKFTTEFRFSYDRDDLREYTCRLAMKFRNGWYYLAEADGSLMYLRPVSALRPASYSGEALFDELYLDAYMNADCRLELYIDADAPVAVQSFTFICEGGRLRLARQTDDH